MAISFSTCLSLRSIARRFVFYRGRLADRYKSKDTTTFYKAEVSANWRAKDISLDRGDYVRLSFEGDEMKVMEVERRFVLAEKEK